MIVDASVAAKWFFEKAGSEEARRILAQERLIAPDLIVAEVCNIAWKKHLAGDVDGERLRRIGQVFAAFFDQLHPAGPFAERDLTIAAALKHPVYDCLYLALAQDTGERVVTADDRLLRTLAHSPWTHLAEPLITLS